MMVMMQEKNLIYLRRDKDEREVITCEVEPSLLADLEAIGKKGEENVTKKEDNPKNSNFQSLVKFFK